MTFSDLLEMEEAQLSHSLAMGLNQSLGFCFKVFNLNIKLAPKVYCSKQDSVYSFRALLCMHKIPETACVAKCNSN